MSDSGGDRLSSLSESFRAKWGERRLAKQISKLGKWYDPFHGDPRLQSLVDDIIRDCRISFFVETGTFVGDTTKFVASRHPYVKVLTCEINRRWYLLARRFCRGLNNIEFFRGESPTFLAGIRGSLLNERVLFWLDAHWRNHWPLVDETKVVATLPTYIVLIDDFKVPRRPAFHFDSYNGTPNDLELHSQVMGKECLVPCYEPDSSCANPAGYGLFMKNMGCASRAGAGTLEKISV